MADKNTIARPYAQALFELAQSSGELVEWSGTLDIARQLLADGQVVEYLSNPELTEARRFEFLTGLFDSGGADLLAGRDIRGTNFLKLLLEYGRVAVVPEIATQFEALKAEVENIVDVMVTSASPLTSEQQQRIVSALRERLGRDIKLETAIDTKLIGGAVIRAGDVVIDGSLRARLEGLSNALIN